MPQEKTFELSCIYSNNTQEMKRNVEIKSHPLSLQLELSFPLVFFKINWICSYLFLLSNLQEVYI